MNRRILTFTIALLTMVYGYAANSVINITQVTGSVDVSSDVDYTITSTEPFTTTGSVNITNIEHAVVIISKIKPSKVISSWLKGHVYINGAQAVNGTNCQVKMYGYGAIIFPYGSNFKPLTVYSGKNYEGTSVNDFGLENSGGYMNTLSEEKLNNKIRSFKLKRGYMVTFSTRAKGRGYSRCFIADKEDLEMPSLPNILDLSISSYRVFSWFNAKKAGLASDTRFASNDALNSSWCYSWGLGETRLPDTECVPNHIYEDWPSSSACGGVTYSCHMKTNNEPGNSADDRPQDVATVLANWENLMATGMRLCSESSHDGSMNHLKAFMDSIDARGWRCDILDLHCYWDSGTFNNLNWYSDHYGNGRPIWISEWVWGASWNHNGFWAKTSTPNDCSEANQTICYNGTVPILSVLNNNSRVERYAYWNSEAAGTHIYHDGALTKLGEFYASMNEGLGYNPDNEFIPKNPRQYDPSKLEIAFDAETNRAVLTWHECNGEYNYSMEIQYKPATATSKTPWSTLKVISLKESEDDYNEEIEAYEGYKYRILIVDANGEERETNTVMAVKTSQNFGDAITVGNDVKYLGGNWLLNGDFEMGLLDWTNGKIEPLEAPYFQVVPIGGYDNSAYLQCLGGENDYEDATAVRKEFVLEENGCYYVSAAGNNNGSNAANSQRISTARRENSELNRHVEMTDGEVWTKFAKAFSIGTDTLLHIRFRDLGGVAQFDEIVVSKLFDTREEALADALEWEKKRATLFTMYNTKYEDLNGELMAYVEKASDPTELEETIKAMLQAYRILENVDSLTANANTIIAYKIPGYMDVQIALSQLSEATTAKEITDAYTNLKELVASCIQYNVEESLITNGSLVNSTGWTTKAGTFKGGDQRNATQADKTCWNAWWNISAIGSEDQTMEIYQNGITIPTNTHGLFALECRATTQHLCENDQHAYLTNVNTETTAESASLPYGLLDLPQIDDEIKWQTLVTPYLYFEDGEKAKIGFVGSKNGAKNAQWRPVANLAGFADNREGWWCATDFKLRYIPMYTKKTTETGYGTVCLPYTFTVRDDVKMYKVAGILSDYSAICVEEETDQIKAGRPYIFYSTPNTDVQFFESGDKASANTNYNGLRGVYISTSKYPLNAIVFGNDGVWKYIATSEERMTFDKYDAYIQKISNLTILDSWEGEKLPTANMPAVPTAIENVKSAQDSKMNSSKIYDLSGKRANADTKGIIIEKGVKKVK